MHADRARRLSLLFFALASLAAVAMGAAILTAAGLPLGSWLRNPIAWGVGAGLGASLYFAGRASWLSAAILVLAVLGLAAAFLAEPVDGVHRWIDLGPLHINVAALLLPAAVVALARAPHAFGLSAAAILLLLLVMQPDASQATALAAAAAFVALRSPAPLALRAGAAVAFAGAALIAWLRPDPLQPVPEVEGIFALALETSPVLASLAALALAAAALAPSRLARVDTAAVPLAIYLVIVALAPFAGAFPVPLVGLGMSAPVGWWLGMAMLCSGPPRHPGGGRDLSG